MPWLADDETSARSDYDAVVTGTRSVLLLGVLADVLDDVRAELGPIEYS